VRNFAQAMKTTTNSDRSLPVHAFDIVISDGFNYI